MKRARKSPDVPLTVLRLSDLMHPPSSAAERRLVNLKVPEDVLVRVHEFAHTLGVAKGAAIIALLNEGLQTAHKLGIGPRRNAKR